MTSSVGHAGLRVRAVLERIRESLFVVPALFVFGGIGLAELVLFVDRLSGEESTPRFLDFTVASAREILSAVATTTVTVSGVVFALISLTVQLASSQYSPRAMRAFLRDRFQQAVMGYVVGVFSYCLFVLREVRAPDEGVDSAVSVPAYATGVAIVLAIGVVLAILAAVNRTAHSLQVSELIRTITDETIARIDDAADPESPGSSRPIEPRANALPVHARSHGWIQQVSMDDLLERLPPETTVWLHVEPGKYVYGGMRIGFAEGPAHADLATIDAAVDDAMALGEVRTMQQDPSFGVRQLVDVALRALSPGVNDPTTAYECIVHIRRLMFRFLTTPAPAAAYVGGDGRRLIFMSRDDRMQLMHLAWDEMRVAAEPLPVTRGALIAALQGLRDDVRDAGAIDALPLIDSHLALFTGAE